MPKYSRRRKGSKKSYNKSKKRLGWAMRIKSIGNWFTPEQKDQLLNAGKSGNALTQTIDDQGNLIGVNNGNTQEMGLKEKENISSADIQMELFEGENIIVGKTDNGQSQLISGPFAKKKNE